MNRKVLFLKVAAMHVVVLGVAFGLMNGCERKRQNDYRLPSTASPPQPKELIAPVEKGQPKPIIEKEEALVIKEYGRPGAVKESELPAPAKVREEEKAHTVEKGDTLSGIADDYGVSLKAIMEVNSIKDPGKLQIGQEIKIPGTS